MSNEIEPEYKIDLEKSTCPNRVQSNGGGE